MQRRPSGDANLSTPAPIGFPLRVTFARFGELNRYFSASDVNIDRIGGSGRLDPTNDQALSPYVAIAPRWQWASADPGLNETPQDINVGFNKRFNLDGSFHLVPIAANTSAETAWSFGLTAFYRSPAPEPRLSSKAVFLDPPVSYVISKDWGASLAVELLGRWYERHLVGETSRDWEALPIATLEYLIAVLFLGGEDLAKILGRPANDFQGSHPMVWSAVPGVSFGQWEARAWTRMAGDSRPGAPEIANVGKLLLTKMAAGDIETAASAPTGLPLLTSPMQASFSLRRGHHAVFERNIFKHHRRHAWMKRSRPVGRAIVSRAQYCPG